MATAPPLPAVSDPDWLLPDGLSRELFERVGGLPAVDFHSHLDAGDLAADRRFDSLTAVWVQSDPYKHRAMRMLGVPERCITGDASSEEKLQRWAEVFPLLIGNPLHDWGRLELHRAFGIDEPFHPGSAERIAGAVRARLGEPRCSARGLLRGAGAAAVCTSDRLLDDLAAHETLAEGRSQGEARVVPSLRGDDLLTVGDPGGHAWLQELGESVGHAATGFDGFGAAVGSHLDRFHRLGTRVADHGIDRLDACPGFELERTPALFEAWAGGASLSAEERARLKLGVLVTLGAAYRERGWALLLHLGAQRRTSTRLRRLAGAAGGYAALGPPNRLDTLAAWLDELERADALPRTVLFNLNPADNAGLATLTGSFARDGEPGYVSWGPAWWFNDHRRGIEAHLDTTADHSLLSIFPGMVSDSRSLLSLHRHGYFRRVLCAWLGRQAAEQRVPGDADALAALASRMILDNPSRLFGPDPRSATTPGAPPHG